MIERKSLQFNLVDAATGTACVGGLFWTVIGLMLWG